VIVFVVDAFEHIGAWFTSLCFESGRVKFLVCFAAPSHIPMMLEFMGATAFLALEAMSTA